MSFLLRPSCCESRDEYNLKVFYIVLSTTSAAAGLLVLAHIYYRESRKRTTLATSIGKLLQYLVIVQCTVDILFHVLDILFATDCDAPPLVYLILKDRDTIFTSRTMSWDIFRQGAGLLSAGHHAITASCIYGYMVLKVSALRLRRSRLPFLLLLAVVVTSIRFTLYEKLRENWLGIYINVLIHDGIMLPAFVLLILRYYYFTVEALKGSAKEASERDVLAGGEIENARSFSSLPAIAEQNSSALLRTGSASGGSSSQDAAAAGGSHDVEHVSVGIHDHVVKRVITEKVVKEGDEVSAREEISITFTNLDPAFRSKGKSSSTVMTSLNRVDGRMDSSSRTLSIIRRLMRISLSISFVWLFIAIVDLYIWGSVYFNNHALGRAVFVCRMIVMRLIGLVDAIVLSDFSIWRFLNCSYFMSVSPRRSKPIDEAVSQDGHRQSNHRRSSTTMPSRSESRLFGPTPEEETCRLVRTLEMINSKLTPRKTMDKVDLFVTTWNMGGINREDIVGDSLFNRLLPKWIPVPASGYDLYVIGVQECECLKGFRDVVHSYLGGPSEYMIYGAEIGESSIINRSIGVTIFVRTSLVQEGIFEVHQGVVNRVNAGVGLGTYRAPNKGMVGLSCRIRDTSIAVIAAHFASDSRGRNKLLSRNQDACRALRELSLHWDSDFFDVQNQHHHCILLGDLNYRCTRSPKEVLKCLQRTARVLQAYAELHRPLGSFVPLNWRTLSYAPLLQPPGLLSFVSSVSDLVSPPSSPERPSKGLSLLSAVSSLGSGDSFLSLRRKESERRIRNRMQQHLPSPSLKFARTSTLNPESYISTAAQDNDAMSLPTLGSLGRASKSGRVSSYLTDGSAETNFPRPLQNRRVSSMSSCFSGSAQSSIAGGEIWEWVLRYDELNRSMKERLVFCGFQESAIAFPPSYRWVPRGNSAATTTLGEGDERDIEDVEAASVKPAAETAVNEGEGLAGDYTDMDTLQKAYTTYVADPPGLFRPLLDTFSRSISGMLTRNESGAISPRSHAAAPPVMSPPPIVAGGRGVSLRTPSYTDRILTHSLPGKAPFLHWRHYDMADQIELSDHRPVAATLTILVAADVRGFELIYNSTDDGRSIAGDSSAAGGGGGMKDDDMASTTGVISISPEKPLGAGGGVSKALFTITLSRPRIRLRSLNLGSILNSSVTPNEATILFPLVSEDPFSMQRKTKALVDAMPGLTTVSSAAASRRDPSHFYASSLSHVEWSAFPFELRTVASLRFSEHLLIKICNSDGVSLGQAVIPIALGLPSFVVSSPTDAEEGTTATKGGPVEGRDGRRLRFVLADGGAFKGWLVIWLKVKVTPLE